jgi:hypothetical protein
MLIGGKREGEGKGEKSIHPSTPAHKLLNGIPYAGWWRVRKKKSKGGKLPFQREKNKNFLDPQSIFLNLLKDSTQVPLTINHLWSKQVAENSLSNHPFS